MCRHFHYMPALSDNFIFVGHCWPSPQVGQGARGQGPNGPKTQWRPCPKGSGTKWASTQVGHDPSGPGPKWSHVPSGSGHKWTMTQLGPGPIFVCPRNCSIDYFPNIIKRTLSWQCLPAFLSEPLSCPHIAAPAMPS